MFTKTLVYIQRDFDAEDTREAARKDHLIEETSHPNKFWVSSDLGWLRWVKWGLQATEQERRQYFAPVAHMDKEGLVFSSLNPSFFSVYEEDAVNKWGNYRYFPALYDWISQVKLKYPKGELRRVLGFYYVPIPFQIYEEGSFKVFYKSNLVLKDWWSVYRDLKEKESTNFKIFSKRLVL